MKFPSQIEDFKRYNSQVENDKKVNVFVADKNGDLKPILYAHKNVKGFTVIIYNNFKKIKQGKGYITKRILHIVRCSDISVYLNHDKKIRNIYA